MQLIFFGFDKSICEVHHVYATEENVSNDLSGKVGIFNLLISDIKVESLSFSWQIKYNNINIKQLLSLVLITNNHCDWMLLLFNPKQVK